MTAAYYAGPSASQHEMDLRYLPAWNGWQSLCSCGGFESEPQTSRPEAFRAHTVHVFHTKAGAR